MPIHDWRRGIAGTFHDFHYAWITEMWTSFNSGLLPDGYYALAEQVAGRPHPAVQSDRTALERERANDERERADAAIALADAERKRANSERDRADVEREPAERLAERLRQLGVDPETM